ncbi:MAG: DUF1232 domain-containing protein [Chitinophagales bacterium]|nr:DUF1232 domain-containing protein [Chitinophagaceae bacterium]MCB9065973.1 DUF1232 domain-containing protein [Chitinophagales bacterium]
MERISTIKKASSLTTGKHVREGAQLFRNRKTLWCMLKEIRMGNYKMSFLTTLIVVLGLLYVVTPFDFDWIPIVGWIDDGLVLYFIFKRLQFETKRFNRHKAMERRVGS